MKVGLYAHRLAAPVERQTGTGRYFQELVRALEETGECKLTLLASGRRQPMPTWQPDGIEVRQFSRFGRLTKLSWAALGRPRLRALNGLDILHVVSPVGPVPATVPTVYTVHDLFPILRPDWYHRSALFMFRRALRHVQRISSPVICPSSYVADQLTDVLGISRSRIHVVHEAPPNGLLQPTAEEVSAARARNAVATDYIISVGAQNRRKNLDVVIDALARLSKEAWSPLLVLAGPAGDASEAIRRRAQAAGLADRVRTTGFVPDPEMLALLAGARALVHPASDEGFGLTTLEAMSVGTPVLAARAGALPEVVGEGGLLLDRDDPESWATAIAELEDERTRLDLAARGRSRAARFSWTRAADETLRVYRLAAA